MNIELSTIIPEIPYLAEGRALAKDQVDVDSR